MTRSTSELNHQAAPAEQPMPDAPDQHSETRRRPVLAVLSLALVTFALSESVFWGQWGQAYGQGPLAALATYTVYLIVVVAVLGVLQRTGAGGRRGLVLGGALLGWLVEGVVVQTTYEALPLSVSFTGLAWHALITVVVGWWGAQVVLTRSLGQALGAAAAAGVAWGLWAAFMAGDLEAGLTADTLDAFAAYVLVTVASLVLGLHGWQTWRGAALVGRWPVRGAFAVLGLAAVATTVVVPLAPVVLAPLLGATWWALRRSPGVPAQLTAPVVPWHRLVGAAGLMGIACIATYGGVVFVGGPVAQLWGYTVYAVTTVAGFAVWAVALRRAYRSARTGDDPPRPSTPLEVVPSRSHIRR